MAKSTSTSLWRPANALSLMGLCLLKALSRLPMGWLLKLGKSLGSLVFYVFPYRKRIALVNLRLCFPEMDERERRRLIYKHYQAMGMGIFELGAAWYKPMEEIQDLFEIIGLEHYDEVVASGRGALLLTGHFTTLEMIGRALVTHRPLSCLYREPDQPVFAREMTRLRTSGMQSVIHMDEIREMIRALRKGEIIWYTPDQGKKIKYSAVLPFFGVPAVTNTATTRIANLGKADILPFVGYRLPNGKYRVEILNELEHLPTNDPESDAVEINKMIEKLVSRAPEQYFWLHKRFKRRGPGYEDVYAR